MYSLIGLIFISFFTSVGFADPPRAKQAEERVKAEIAAEEAENVQRIKNKASTFRVEDHNRIISNLEKDQKELSESNQKLTKRMQDYKNNKSSDEYAFKQRDLIEYEEQIKKNKEKIEQNRVAILAHNSLLTQKKFKTNSEIEYLGMKLDANHLLATNAQLKTMNNNQAIDFSKLESQLKDTLLGQYTKYVVDEKIKQALNNSDNVCDAIKNCGETKKTRAQISSMNKKVKDFEQWKSTITNN